MAFEPHNNMNPVVVPSRVNKPTIQQILAWAAWAGFMLFAVAACFFERAETHDPYFIAHYQNYPKGGFTTFMTSYSAWMLVPPFLWLPFVIAYHLQNYPKWVTLLFLAVSMFMARVTLAVLLLCSDRLFKCDSSAMSMMSQAIGNAFF